MYANDTQDYKLQHQERNSKTSTSYNMIVLWIARPTKCGCLIFVYISVNLEGLMNSQTLAMACLLLVYKNINLHKQTLMTSTGQEGESACSITDVVKKALMPDICANCVIIVYFRVLPSLVQLLSMEDYPQL
jgi:hypothetical protein